MWQMHIYYRPVFFDWGALFLHPNTACPRANLRAYQKWTINILTWCYCFDDTVLELFVIWLQLFAENKKKDLSIYIAPSLWQTTVLKRGWDNIIKRRMFHFTSAFKTFGKTRTRRKLPLNFTILEMNIGHQSDLFFDRAHFIFVHSLFFWLKTIPSILPVESICNLRTF